MDLNHTNNRQKIINKNSRVEMTQNSMKIHRLNSGRLFV